MKLCSFVLTILMLSFHGTAHAEEEPLVSNKSVPAFTRLLEDQPLHPQAKVLREMMLQWEAESKDVVDVVCPGIFAPLPDEHFKYNSELLAQFIFGSAAYQLDHPSDKGKLMPAQLAGMLSMLRTYLSILAKDSSARMPRLDELSAAKADGSLEAIVTTLVTKECK